MKIADDRQNIDTNRPAITTKMSEKFIRNITWTDHSPGSSNNNSNTGKNAEEILSISQKKSEFFLKMRIFYPNLLNLAN